MRPDFKFFYFDTLVSTNDYAKEFADKGLSNIVIVARKQEKGRGRLGRKWTSQLGGLYMTIILKEKALDKARFITFMAAVSVVKAIMNVSKLDAKVKWPNDVLIGNKKICGILTETIARNRSYALVGIGLNVNQKEFPKTLMGNSTSLAKESNKEYNIKELSKSIIKEFNNLYSNYSKADFKKIIAEWKKNSHTLGKVVRAKTISGNYTGKAIDVDSDCSLILRLRDGSTKKIIEGDIFVV